MRLILVLTFCVLLFGSANLAMARKTRATTEATVSEPTSAPASRPAAESKDPRLQCAAHMRQLLLASVLWSNTHHLSAAPDLESIFGEMDEDLGLEPKLVVCPVDRTVKSA